MSVLITGVAGFIGCNLAKDLISKGKTVFGVDNFSRGSLNNIDALIKSKSFIFRELNLLDLNEFTKTAHDLHIEDPITEVWHLAANSDIPAGVSDANVDLHDTFMTTFNTLEVMKKIGIHVLYFSSSSAIYGDFGEQEIKEDVGPLMPISNYGAMKLASEALISAALESFLEKVCIYRFPNVVGIPATHGVILDFITRLKNEPNQLSVLGNGQQQKTYLHVSELIEAMLFINSNTDVGINYYNIGAQDRGISVKQISEITVSRISPDAKILYQDSDRGWVGDVPRFYYCIDKLNELGWRPNMSSLEVITRAVNEIALQEDL
jgi:UDP-glucose 4-epimerase